MQESTTPTRLLRLPAVLDRVPVSKTQWYRQIRAGIAPASVSLSARAVAWRESDIDAYIRKISPESK